MHVHNKRTAMLYIVIHVHVYVMYVLSFIDVNNQLITRALTIAHV